jgi:hypothetical protein
VIVVLDCIEHLFSACLPTSIWCSQQVSSSEIFFLIPLNKKEVVTTAKSSGTKWVPEESTRSQIINECGWCFETAYLEPSAAEPSVTLGAAAVGATNITAYWTAATAHSTFMDRGAPLLHQRPSPPPPPAASPLLSSSRVRDWVGEGSEECGVGDDEQKGRVMGVAHRGVGAYPFAWREGQKWPYGNTTASCTPE